jgi:hypothetical protein
MVSTSPRYSATYIALATALPAALLAGLAAFWLLGGFESGSHTPETGPVMVAAPVSAAPRCATLVAALPRELAGRPARPVSGAARQAAAWGDPAIVLRCGVAEAPVSPTAQLLIIEGVSWTTTETDAAVRWTSTSLPVPVEILVPNAYRDIAAAEILNPLAAPIKKAQG